MYSGAEAKKRIEKGVCSARQLGHVHEAECQAQGKQWQGKGHKVICQSIHNVERGEPSKEPASVRVLQ